MRRGIISPILFCIYIDGLLLRRNKLGVGCFIGNIFDGALAYVDDIVLMAPSSSAIWIPYKNHTLHLLKFNLNSHLTVNKDNMQNVF